MKFLKSEISRMLLITKWILGLYFRSYPFYTSIFVICRILVALSGLVNAYVIAVATDAAIKFVTESPSMVDIYKVILLVIGSYFFFALVDIINNYVWRMMVSQEWFMLRKTLADRLLGLGIRQLEDPEITNKTQRFNESTGNILDYLQIVVNTFASIIALIGSSLLIINSIPLVALLYFVVVIIQFASNQKFIRLLWVFSRDTTEARRSASTDTNLLIEPKSLKELILSGGTTYLWQRIDKYLEKVIHEVRRIRMNWNFWKVVNRTLDSAVFGYGVFLILRRVIDKVITVGQLTFEIRSLRIFADNFNNIAGNLVDLRESTIKISDIYDIFSKYEVEVDGKIKLETIDLDIKLDNVNFKYPNSKRTVFKDLSLVIKAGEKIAIVGENGAGKTTLIKIICRLYRVNKGKVLIGGFDINDLKINDWYQKIGVLFQDYNAYGHLTVKENIEIDSFNKTVTNDSIKEVLKKADALDFVEKYKNGIDQILSERYKGGIRPSTGQWQKIAIARVFHRNSPVLILDEPTASIDAVAEAAIFDNIYKFAKDKTVIIISHRFSTVRNADRIIVLDKGKIVEQGSHEELLKNDGKYAHAFKLQAKGYQ